jgi:hypothetical protein
MGLHEFWFEHVCNGHLPKKSRDVQKTWRKQPNHDSTCEQIPLSPPLEKGEGKGRTAVRPYSHPSSTVAMFVIRWADTQVRAYPAFRGTFGGVGDSASHVGVSEEGSGEGVFINNIRSLFFRRRNARGSSLSCQFYERNSISLPRFVLPSRNIYAALVHR